MYDGFLTNGYRADQTFSREVLEDTASATLSRAFRIYYRLRRLIPVPVRWYLQRHHSVEAKDDWFLPSGFMHRLVRSLACEPGGVRIIHPWPDGARYCLVLTHDVETRQGMRNVRRVAQIEEELGFRSSWNMVPHKYDVDPGLVRDLQSRSFEIGIHGHKHDGRLYTSKRVFDQRAAAINVALKKHHATGFRSPMVHRNLEWLQVLDIEYDASCFDIDPFQAMPGGVGSIWPFVAGKFVELPYTMPQDHTLFIALRQTDCRVWERKLDFIIRHYGMALMLTHPDYLTSRRNLALYRDFLSRLRDLRGFWHALPRDVAAWWRLRAQSCIAEDGEDRWRVRGPVADRGVPVAVEVNGKGITLRRLSPAGR